MTQKINPHNAFELPVKVIDPLGTQSANTRFWKFASELLFASAGVYDKRVENMYQTTNRMFDSLLRVHREGPEEEEEGASQQNKSQKGLNQMDVRDIGKVKNMAHYDEIGSYHTEEP